MGGLTDFLIGAGRTNRAIQATIEHNEDRDYTKGQREKASRLDDMRIEEAQAGLEAARAKRASQLAYGEAIRGATDEVDALGRIAQAAQAHGDVPTYTQSRAALASKFQERYRKNVVTALQNFKMTGDPRDLTNVFGSIPSEGRKLDIRPNDDGTFSMSVYGADARLVGPPRIMSADDIEQAAMLSVDSSGKTFEKMIDGKVKANLARIKGEEARQTIGAKLEADREIHGLDNQAKQGVANTNAEARKYAADKGLAGAKARASATTEAAKTRAGAGGVKADPRVAQGASALGKVFGANSLSGLDPANQVHFSRALARMEELVKGGGDPMAAARQAFNETNPKNPRAAMAARDGRGASAPAPGKSPAGLGSTIADILKSDGIDLNDDDDE